MYDTLDNEQLKAANPSSVFAAENGDVEKAIEVLSKEAKVAESNWEREMLEATVRYLENEVL